MQATEVRDREIEFRLEAFARARLSPDPQSIARSRARIMREARLQFEAAQQAAASAPPIVTMPRRRLARRLAMPILAAGMWAVLTVGSVFAAQAGGPLYPTRIWIENATLPASGASRVTAEIARLDARLREAGDAASRGDTGAVGAALEAYRAIADEALAGSTGEASLEAMIGSALAHHTDTLTAVAAALAGKGNDTAAASIDASIRRAIDHNAVVVNRIADHALNGAGTNNGGTNNGGTNNGGTNNGAGGPAGGATGTATPEPTATPRSGGGGDAGNGGDGTGSKPSKPPKATAAPRVQHTPAPPKGPDASHPDHTPRSGGR